MLFIIDWFRKRKNFKLLNKLFQQHFYLDVSESYELLSKLYELEYESKIPNTQETSQLNKHETCFRINGHNPGSPQHEYFGQLELHTIQNSESKEAIWKIGHTEQPMHGTAYSYQNYLYIHFYYIEKQQKFRGFIIYKQISEGKYHGFWMEENYNSIGKEDLFLQ